MGTLCVLGPRRAVREKLQNSWFVGTQCSLSCELQVGLAEVRCCSMAGVRVDTTAMPARWCALLKLPDVGVQQLATCNASATPERPWASPKGHLPREELM